MKQNEYYLFRLDILKKMILLMDYWDGTAESAIKLIAENEKNISDFKQYEAIVADYKLKQGNNEEKKILEAVIKKQQKMMHQINVERKSIVNQSKQLNQKDNIIKHYVSVALAPVFVDKGM